MLQPHQSVIVDDVELYHCRSLASSNCSGCQRGAADPSLSADNNTAVHHDSRDDDDDNGVH